MMHSHEAMTKDLMFKLRLDTADRERLEKLSEHFGAPAATVVRMLIKEKHDDITGVRITSLFGETQARLMEQVREMMLDPMTRAKKQDERRRADKLLTREIMEEAQKKAAAKEKKPKK